MAKKRSRRKTAPPNRDTFAALRKAVAGKRGRKPRPANRKALTLPTVAPGPLTPDGRVGPYGHREAVATITIEQRRERVLDLYTVQQLTMEQIAKVVGVSNATVCNDLHVMFNEIRTRRLQKLDDYREQALRRLARNDRAILPLLYGKIDGENPKAPVTPFKRALLVDKAHKRLTESERVRAMLEGTAAPQKVTFTDPTGERRYDEMSVEDLERLLRQREADLLPVVDGEVVKREEAPVLLEKNGSED